MKIRMTRATGNLPVGGTPAVDGATDKTLQNAAECASTFLSTDDVKSLETEAGCCPPTEALHLQVAVILLKYNKSEYKICLSP
jgi:hypothetical protein